MCQVIMILLGFNKLKGKVFSMKEWDNLCIFMIIFWLCCSYLLRFLSTCPSSSLCSQIGVGVFFLLLFLLLSIVFWLRLFCPGGAGSRLERD